MPSSFCTILCLLWIARRFHRRLQILRGSFEWDFPELGQESTYQRHTDIHSFTMMTTRMCDIHAMLLVITATGLSWQQCWYCWRFWEWNWWSTWQDWLGWEGTRLQPDDIWGTVVQWLHLLRFLRQLQTLVGGVLITVVLRRWQRTTCFLATQCGSALVRLYAFPGQWIQHYKCSKQFPNDVIHINSPSLC